MSVKKLFNKASSFIAESKKESLSRYLDCCKYTLTSNSEIVLEGDMYVHEYSDTRIIFSEEKNLVEVTGKELELCYLKQNTAKINGIIFSIEFRAEDSTV